MILLVVNKAAHTQRVFLNRILDLIAIGLIESGSSKIEGETNALVIIFCSRISSFISAWKKNDSDQECSY